MFLFYFVILYTLLLFFSLTFHPSALLDLLAWCWTSLLQQYWIISWRQWWWRHRSSLNFRWRWCWGYWGWCRIWCWGTLTLQWWWRWDIHCTRVLSISRWGFWRPWFHSMIWRDLTALSLLPCCRPCADLIALFVANIGSNTNNDKDRSNDNENDLPNLHAVENWWQLWSSWWDDYIWRRFLWCHHLISKQSIKWSIIVQCNL